MSRPGTSVQLISTPTLASLPTDTGTAFVVGLADRGPLAASLIKSLSDFINIFGTRQTYSLLYDAVELYFREGGDHAYISRVVGPGDTFGTHNLLDVSSGTSLIVTAIGPGAWSANYKVAVVAGVGAGTYKIQVTDANNVVLEDSGDLADQNSAVEWALSNSKYIRVAIGGSSLNPNTAAAAALSAGNDDRGSITDTQWLNALNMFTSDLGPGQVLAPGRTSTTGQQQLIDHAEANGRCALVDLQDTATVATLDSAAAALSNSRFAAAFAPWITIPGASGTTQVSRTVPPSALVAGLIARNDPTLGPNRPSAGIAGVSRYATGLSQIAWSDANRATLNTNGVNVIRNIAGSIRVYGWRSQADPNTDSDWLDFGNGRLFMKLSAEFDAAAENFVFDEIDGQNGQTIGNFHTALAGICLHHYLSGELFGDTADQAFVVDTGPSVNTLVTIQNLELHGSVGVKMSPMAEYVQINVIKRQVSEVLT